MFTKAEAAKLPVEQQEILAQLELSNLRQRQQLLKEAHGLDWRSRYFPIYTFVIFLILIAFSCFAPVSEEVRMYALYVLAGLMFVSCVVYAHTTRINRRLDALLKLLEMEHKFQNSGDISKDKKIG
jgi:Flp pilus assembly protein TadB